MPKHFLFIAFLPLTFSALIMPWQPLRTSFVVLALSVLLQGRSFSSINSRLYIYVFIILCDVRVFVYTLMNIVRTVVTRVSRGTVAYATKRVLHYCSAKWPATSGGIRIRLAFFRGYHCNSP